MNPKHLPFAIFLITLAISCSSKRNTIPNFAASDRDSATVRKDFQKYFDDCAVEGSIAIYDNNNERIRLV